MKKIPLKMEVAALKTELNEYEELFKLQRLRMKEAIVIWQSETGNAYNPDLGKMLNYLLSKRSLLYRLHAVLKKGGYASNEYADIMNTIERKGY